MRLVVLEVPRCDACTFFCVFKCSLKRKALATLAHAVSYEYG